MSLQNNEKSLSELVKKANERNKMFELPKPLQEMLDRQEKIVQAFSPSTTMQEIFKQQKIINKIYQYPRSLQIALNTQKRFEALFPKLLKSSSSLFLSQSAFTSNYRENRFLATQDNFSAIQSLSETIAKQQSIFSNPSISALLNVQRYMKLLPADMQTQLVDDAIEASQVFDTSEKVLSEVTDFFKNTEEYDIRIPVEERTFPQISAIAISIIFYILSLLNDQFQMALFEYYSKPILAPYLTSKEVKSLVKDEVKKNDLTSLYGKRVASTSLNLRIESDKNSEIIETIEKGKFLYIIKEVDLHKSWLKVEVDINGEKIQGYVLRRYTLVIKP